MYIQVETSSDPYYLVNKNPNQCSRSVTFGTNPDPWIRTLDYGSESGSGSGLILLFSSVTFEMPTKFMFFYTFFCLLLTIIKKSYNSRNHVLNF
jgi:hypothetical protein